MICPECSSTLIVAQPFMTATKGDLLEMKVYHIDCSRCLGKFVIQLVTVKKGNPELIKKYKTWLNEDREKGEWNDR